MSKKRFARQMSFELRKTLIDLTYQVYERHTSCDHFFLRPLFCEHCFRMHCRHTREVPACNQCKPILYEYCYYPCPTCDFYFFSCQCHNKIFSS